MSMTALRGTIPEPQARMPRWKRCVHSHCFAQLMTTGDNTLAVNHACAAVCVSRADFCQHRPRAQFKSTRPRRSSEESVLASSPGMESESLDRSIAAVRKWLAIPLESMVRTEQEFRRLSPPPRPKGPVPQPSNDSYLMTRGVPRQEIPAESRRAFIDALRQPERVVFSLRQGARQSGPIVLPMTFGVATPLTTAERAQLRSQQAAELERFDQCITETRGVLLQLATEGANPLFILSILLGYGSRSGTVFPSSQGTVLHRSQFALETPLAWLKPGAAMEPVRLTGATTSSPQRARRRRGPAGIGPNVGMALLAKHFRVATKRRQPHATEIATLFGVWGRDLRGLTREIVYRRIKRVEEQHAKEFHRLARDEAQQMDADRTFFERLVPS